MCWCALKCISKHHFSIFFTIFMNRPTLPRPSAYTNKHTLLFPLKPDVCFSGSRPPQTPTPFPLATFEQSTTWKQHDDEPPPPVACTRKRHVEPTSNPTASSAFAPANPPLPPSPMLLSPHPPPYVRHHQIRSTIRSGPFFSSFHKKIEKPIHTTHTKSTRMHPHSTLLPLAPPEGLTRCQLQITRWCALCPSLFHPSHFHHPPNFSAPPPPRPCTVFFFLCTNSHRQLWR